MISFPLEVYISLSFISILVLTRLPYFCVAATICVSLLFSLLD